MEKKKVLGLSFGRKMMNTEILVKEALMACEAAGHEVKFIRVDELDIKPCTGCCACAVGFVFGNGRGDCVLKDDFHILEEAMYEADAVIIGSPTFVLSPSGTFKTVADRLGPSHDYSAKVVRYKAGKEAGEPEEKLPDVRSFKPRVGAFIAVGGALTENWLSFMLPSMYQMTFPFNIDIIDMFKYFGALKTENVVALDDKMERASKLGQNIAEALNAETEEERVKWRSDIEGVCPHCHCDFLSVSHDNNKVECPVCGIEGELHMDDNGIQVTFTEEEQKKSRLRWGGKIAHSEELKRTPEFRQNPIPGLKEKLEKYKNYAE